MSRLGQGLRALGAGAARASQALLRLVLRLARGGAAAAARVWGAGPARRLRAALGAGARVLALAALLAGLALAGGWLVVRRVPPGAVGVLQRRVGAGGFDARDLGAGLVLAPRGLWRLHLLDARTQLASFASASEGVGARELRVRTKDGNVARVAARVPFRLRSGEAHLVVAEGLRATWPELARSAIERTLLVELANLSSDELATTETRLARGREALARLEAELAPLHVAPEGLEICAVVFPPEYEATLQKKQLSRQLARLDRAEVALQDRELAVRTLEMDIEREVLERRAGSEREIAELVAGHRSTVEPLRTQAAALRALRRAEAEAERQRLVAEGERALAEARAEGARRRAGLLASPGGRLWLAREAARRLRLERVVLDSRDPRVPTVLELDELVRALAGPPAPR